MTTSKAGPEEVPITSSRAVRMAMRRAADKAHGLVVAVQGMQEETIAVDGLAEAIPEDHLLVGLERREVLVGLAAIDVQLRAAVIEMQTMGRLQSQAAEARPATATDAMMLTDLLAMLLKMLGETTVRTDLEGWTDAAQIGHRVPSLRAAGLALADADYRVIRLRLDLGGSERQGELTLLLPVGNTAVAEVILPDAGANWQRHFKQTVLEAKATLSAELHRFSVPLHMAEGLVAGQVIPLPGCTVGSVQMRDPEGRAVATARLGQFAGKRAVRLEVASELQMTEATGFPVEATEPAQLQDAT